MRAGFDLGLNPFSRREASFMQGAPEAPSGLTLKQQDTALDLEWDAASGVTWTVYRSEEIDDFASAEVIARGLTSPGWTDAGDVPRAPCCYWVTACRPGMESMPSLPALGHLLPPQGSAVLQALTGSGSRDVWLDWTEADIELETGWTLYSKGPSGSGFSRHGGLTSQLTIFTAAETGEWEFYVKAANALGEGRASNTVSVILSGEACGIVFGPGNPPSDRIADHHGHRGP